VGHSAPEKSPISIQGSIDRVTGAVSEIRMGRAKVERINTDRVDYSLKSSSGRRPCGADQLV